MDKRNIAGISLRGGRKDNFYLCLLEDYEDSDRLFLKSLLQVKDEDQVSDGDDVIRSWINNYGLKELVVDFPQSRPACQRCELDCPGRANCQVTEVKTVNDKISAILGEDQRLKDEDPKGYERDRNKTSEIDYSRDVMAKETTSHILSRSFRRRLKKGYLPYWNRPIDFWVWSNYYDQLLSFFNVSYDSFGNTSLMLNYRFDYIKRHFPKDTVMLESNVYILMIELLRSKIIRKRDLEQFLDIETGIDSRIAIIRGLENSCGVFVYDQDFEVLVKNPRAFQSFLLAFAGWFYIKDRTIEIPEWAGPKNSSFILPSF